MSVANRVVVALLRSPLHRLLSGRVAVVRYTGRRSGRQVSTPVQYVEDGEDLLVLVGRADDKSWWRNFVTDHDAELLVRSRWRAMTACVLRGRDDPRVVAPLLDRYVERFPKAAKALPAERDRRLHEAVMVRCWPRPVVRPT